jgi:hypothetical protein
MGLDTYASARHPTDEDWQDFHAQFGRTAEDDAAFEAVDGPYFRGKIFDELVRAVTGVSLYREWIPPETVRFMADALDDCSQATLDGLRSSYPRFQDVDVDLEFLRGFFRVCVDRHLGLAGSW